MSEMYDLKTTFVLKGQIVAILLYLKLKFNST